MRFGLKLLLLLMFAVSLCLGQQLEKLRRKFPSLEEWRDVLDDEPIVSPGR